MSMAGGRFSRSVILPTSREFSKVPQFMTHPRWDIFTQFLRYPTAFSNTVLKNFARDILNNPKANGPRFAAFVVGATAIARGTNYWRSSDERQREYDRNARELDDDSLAGKAFDAIVGRSFDENLRAFQRVGLLGPYEYIQRYKDAYRANPNMFLAATSLGGPIMSDFTGSAVYGRGAFETLAKKTPLIGTRNVVKRYTGVDPFEPLLEGAREQDEKVGEFLEDFFGTEPGKRTGIGYDNIDYGRPGYAKGGIVKKGFENLGRKQYNQGGEEQSPVDITVESLISNYKTQEEKDYKKDSQGEFIIEDTDTDNDGTNMIYTGNINVNKEPRRWVKDMYYILRDAGHPFPKIAAVQSGFESRYGMSDLARGYNNVFGIKSDDGVLMKTTEDYGDGRGLVTEEHKFATYKNLNEGVEDYIRFTGKNRYAQAFSADSPRGYIEGLKAGGYATDPKYVDKIFNAYELYESEGLFDEE